MHTPMDPKTIVAENREKIVKELGLEHVSAEDQDLVIESVGEILFKRIMLKMLAQIPETEQDAFVQAVGAYKFDESDAMIKKYVPNVGEMIVAELSAGIQEYKTALIEVVEDDKKKANNG